MTILLRIVQMVQVITTKTSQKRLVLLPVRFAFVFRNSPRSSTYHSGPRASREKLRKNWVAGHENIIWVVDSGTTHNWHIPLARLKTSTPKGMRSRSNWHTKDLNLEEERGFSKQGCLRKRGPLNRARYANLTLNDPEEDKHQDTLSIITASRQCAQRRSCNASHARASPGWIPVWTGSPTRPVSHPSPIVASPRRSQRELGNFP
jgi:hypothetical protein